MSETKICKACKGEKSISDFPKNKNMRDGHLHKCKTCEYARVKEWRKRNPERVSYLLVKWRAENPEQVKQHLRKHYIKNATRIGLVRNARYEKNREKELAQCKAYQSNNPAYRNKKNATRRAAYVLALPKWLTPIQQVQIDELYEIARAKTVQTGRKHDVDHIIPLRAKNVCGLHVPWNLQVLGARENNRKFNKVMEL